MSGWKAYEDIIIEDNRSPAFKNGLLPWGCSPRTLLCTITPINNNSDGKTCYRRNKVVSPTICTDNTNASVPASSQASCLEVIMKEKLTSIHQSDPNAIITSSALANLLNTSVRTIQRMAKDGRLPSQNRGSKNIAWEVRNLLNICS